jgi:F-type H+-transporting ATPase subunit epsilon
MADTFEIEIATPERLLGREKAVRAQIPAKDGYIGVLPDHAALLSQLGSGALTYTTPEDHRFSLAISGGFVEINDNVVRVLSDVAEKGQEIDVSRAEKALKRAQDAMGNPALGIDIASALGAALRAQARIDAARKAANKEE